MRYSQFLKAYQTEQLFEICRGRKPYAVGTFLAYRLQGKAKQYSDVYYRTLVNSLEQVGWEQCSSKCKGLAYAPPEKSKKKI